jgi:hypothetical protein
MDGLKLTAFFVDDKFPLYSLWVNDCVTYKWYQTMVSLTQ